MKPGTAARMAQEFRWRHHQGAHADPTPVSGAHLRGGRRRDCRLGVLDHDPDLWRLVLGPRPEAAARVVADLQASQTRYKLDAGGRTVRVPASELDTLRLQFASSGLPDSGRIGFEIFDRTAFGATEFIEQVNLRRRWRVSSHARSRRSARLTAPCSCRDGPAGPIRPFRAEGDSFSGPPVAPPQQPLRSNDPRVSNLVAAGVEGLEPEAVVLMDSFGDLLHPTDDAPESSGSGRHTERREQLEQDLTRRVVALLEPVAGTGRVRANVAVILRTESEEATEESWDPTTVVARSRHVSGDRAFLDAAAQGLSGARANLPPRAATASSTPPSGDAAADDTAPIETPAGPMTQAFPSQRRLDSWRRHPGGSRVPSAPKRSTTRSASLSGGLCDGRRHRPPVRGGHSRRPPRVRSPTRRANPASD